MRTIISISIILSILFIYLISSSFYLMPSPRTSEQNYAHALMEEKFIFFHRVIYIENEPKEDINYILKRSQNEIPFMESLTGIASTHSFSHHLGKKFINEKDFVAWTVWYFKNKPFIQWDEDRQKIIFKKP